MKNEIANLLMLCTGFWAGCVLWHYEREHRKMLQDAIKRRDDDIAYLRRQLAYERREGMGIEFECELCTSVSHIRIKAGQREWKCTTCGKIHEI